MDEMVSKLVEAAMESANVNLERLAELTAIPRVTLGRRLKQGHTFTIGELDRVADALDVDLLDLIPKKRTQRSRSAAQAVGS